MLQPPQNFRNSDELLVSSRCNIRDNKSQRVQLGYIKIRFNAASVFSLISQIHAGNTSWNCLNSSTQPCGHEATQTPSSKNCPSGQTQASRLGNKHVLGAFGSEQVAGHPTASHWYVIPIGHALGSTP